MGQNMLWLEAHIYKWLISIFKEIASLRTINSYYRNDCLTKLSAAL